MSKESDFWERQLEGIDFSVIETIDQPKRDTTRNLNRVDHEAVKTRYDALMKMRRMDKELGIMSIEPSPKIRKAVGNIKGDIADFAKRLGATEEEILEMLLQYGLIKTDQPNPESLIEKIKRFFRLS